MSVAFSLDPALQAGIQAYYTNNPNADSSLAGLRAAGFGDQLDQIYSRYGITGLQGAANYAQQAAGQASGNNNDAYFADATYSGPPVNQPPASTTSTTGSTSSGSTTPTFNPVQYNGQNYTDPHAYYQALLANAVSAHDQSVKQAQTAYNQGLINYDQQQQALDLSRTKLKSDLSNNMSQISGYFSNVSPFAYQSEQNNQEGVANTNFQTGSNQLDTQGQNLATARTNTGTNYQNNLTALDQALQGQKDTLVNSASAYNTTPY